MTELFGRLSIDAKSGNEGEIGDHISEINRVIKPPRKVQADSVYVGVLYAASDQVNLQGGCFAESGLRELAQLIVDAPVMVGHKKQELPLGRVFKGEVVEKGGAPWLKAWFYWSRDQKGADQLKAGIDSGIYKECSLGFLYDKPECAICREDMCKCRHRINETIELGGRRVRAFFYYKDIRKVLEISLVYRGAVEGTSVSTLEDSPQQRTLSDTFRRLKAKPVFALDQIDTPLEDVIVEPLYNGLWLEVMSTQGQLQAKTIDGTPWEDDKLFTELRQSTNRKDYHLLAQVVPMRGSSRLPLHRLLKLSSLSGERPALKLLLVDLIALDGRDVADRPLLERKRLLSDSFARSHQVAPMPYHHCNFMELVRQQEKKGSAEGMVIINVDLRQNEVYEYRRRPLVRGEVSSQVEGDRQRHYISFDSAAEDATTKKRPYPLNCGSTQVETGDIIFAQPATSSDSFEFVDLCQPGLLPDSTEIGHALLEKGADERFNLFLDDRGNYWLDLQLRQQNQLIRIAKLRQPLLEKGRRFWCHLVEPQSSLSRATGRICLVDRGDVACHSDSNDVLQFTLQGNSLKGAFRVEPCRFGEKRGYLFYKITMCREVIDSERGDRAVSGEHSYGSL